MEIIIVRIRKLKGGNKKMDCGKLKLCKAAKTAGIKIHRKGKKLVSDANKRKIFKK